MDITLKNEGYRFDLRASCILKNKEHNKVILNKMRVITDHEAYLLPGGKLNIMENSLEAVKREILEELDIKIECKLVSIEEIIVKEEKIHVVDFVYYAELEDINCITENESFKIFDINQLEKVDLKPYSLQDLININDYNEITHHLSYEEKDKHKI